MTIHVVTKRCLLGSILDEKRMTKTRLSDETGISIQQLSDYIHMRKGMSLNNAKRISVVLNCSIDSLYDFEIYFK